MGPMVGRMGEEDHHSEEARERAAPATGGADRGPAEGPSGALRHLQRSAGNRAVARALQPKLEVGASDDPHEREADRVAAEVVGAIRRMTHPIDPRADAPITDGRLARTTKISRQVEVGAEGGELSTELSSAISSTGGGAALDDTTRSKMEAAFGTDFSTVRIHRDSAVAPQIGATAFTHDRDIHFAPGRFEPASPRGQKLLAHELTHVVQQTGPTRATGDEPNARRAAVRRSPRLIRRAVPTEDEWKSFSSGWKFPRRSAELQAIDQAIGAYHRACEAGVDDRMKVAWLSAIQDQILVWKQEKQDTDTGELDSGRLDKVEALEDEIEAERMTLEATIGEGIATSEIDEDFTKLGVYSMGTVVDSKTGFIDETKEQYDSTKADLEEDHLPASDVDVRLAMLTAKVQEAHLHLGRQQAADRDAKIIGLFTAAESVFQRPYAPYTKADKEKIVGSVRALSSTHENLLIVPGSIMWGAGRGDEATLNNTAIAVMNGQLVHETAKHTEGIDIVTYTRLLSGEKAATDHTGRTGQREDEWVRGGGRTASKGSKDPSEEDSSLFQVGGLTMSLEICNDHNEARAVKEMSKKNIDPANGVHVQILVSAGAPLGGPHQDTMDSLAMRPGGIGVATDASRTSADKKGVRKVIQGDPKAPRAQKQSAADLADLFMGVYQLPD